MAEGGVEGCRQGAKGHREGGCSGCGGADGVHGPSCPVGMHRSLSKCRALRPADSAGRTLRVGAEWVQHIAARSRGTREWREGRRWVERHAAAMETGKAQKHNKSCPAAIRLWCAYDGVGAPESWPLGPRQFCGESSNCLGLVWLWRPWSTCATQCWPLRHPSTWKLCALSSLGAVPRPVAPLVRAEKH